MTTINSVRKGKLLINRNFSLLWVGNATSRIGDSVFATTLVLWIATSIAHGQPWAPLAVSGIFITSFIPIFIFGPIAGVLVDHWKEKRRVMLHMDMVRAVLIVMLLLIAEMKPLLFISGGYLAPLWQLGSIYVIVFLVMVSAQFFIQASNVLYYDVVEEMYRAQSAGLLQMIGSIAAIAGPPLATLLFFAVGPQWALVLNALSFIVSFFCTLAVRVPKITQEREDKEESQRDVFLAQLSEGIKFFFRNSILMAILITSVLAYLWESTFGTLGIFYVSQNLGVSVSLYGFFGTAVGAGIAIGSLLVGLLAHRLGEARIFGLSTMLLGGLIIIYARLTHIVPALVVTFLIGILVASFNVTAYPLILHVTPRNFIGRVASVLGSIVTFMAALSAALVGWLASTVLHDLHVHLFTIWFGPIDTIFTIVGILVIVGGIHAVIKLRGVTIASKNEQEMEMTEVNGASVNNDTE